MEILPHQDTPLRAGRLNTGAHKWLLKSLYMTIVFTLEGSHEFGSPHCGSCRNDS